MVISQINQNAIRCCFSVAYCGLGTEEAGLGGIGAERTVFGRIGAERSGLGGVVSENTGFGGEGIDLATLSPGSGPDLSSWIGLQVSVDGRFTILRVGFKVWEDSAGFGADIKGELDKSVEVDLIGEEVSEEKDAKDDDDGAVCSMEEPHLENKKNI